MGIQNVRTPYQFDPETDDGQYSGGLLGRLRAMMQQSQGGEYFQPGADSGLTPNGANSDGSPQGGLLGRLLALQAEQSPYQPFAGSDGQPTSASRDPNFRQLERVYITGRTQDGTDSGRPTSYLGQSNDDTSQASESNTSAPASAIKTAQLVLPGGIPFPPPVPVPPRPIPMPAIPDWWKAAGMLLQLHRRILSGDGGDDKNPCYDRWEGEHGRCTMFRPFGYRYQLACEARANDRLRLCHRNGGTPDPEEPAEYDWNDIPRDPATR